MKTKVDSELAAAEEAHQNDPERAELLARTRRFKASWIELAEALTHVRKRGTWQRWGYQTVEEYAQKELKLRADTVEKLTGSYAFLKRSAPQVLERDGVEHSIPSYQAVDFLRRAEEREDAPEGVVSDIRKKVLDDVLPLPTVAREYKSVVFPIDEAEQKKKDAAALKNVATRLRDLLGDTRAVSRRLAGTVSSALDELLTALDGESSRAA